MLYSIKTFGGMLPKIEPRLLQEANAQLADNSALRSGAAVPFYAPYIEAYLADPVDEYKTLCLHEHTSDTLFLRFEDDVDIVRGPIANDAQNRSYITGLDVPRVFDNTLLSPASTIIDSTNSYKLALPIGAAATLATNGAGTGEEVSRAYLYTYIREWSGNKTDEGQPSDPAQLSGQQYIDIRVGDTVTISDIEDCPDVANNNVSRLAIYRTVTSSSDTDWQLVIEFDIAEGKAGYVAGVTWSAGSSTFTYADTKTDSDLGEVLTSLLWAPPSDSLQGLVSLKNGALVAFDDNVVYFSELYQPHAWPTSYQVTVDDQIVGLGVFGNTVVVLTDRTPILLNAQDPSSIIAAPTHSLAPCTSKQGIVTFENNVYFPSINGLFIMNGKEIKNLTQDLYTYEGWAELAPSSFKAAIQNGRFFTYYQNDASNESGFLIIDLQEALAGAVKSSTGAASLVVDPTSDELYYIENHPTLNWVINKWEGTVGASKTMTWKSKLFTTTTGPANFAVARVRAGFLSAAELAKINAALAAYAAAQKGNLKGAVNEVPLNIVTFNGDIFSSLLPNYALVPSLVFRFYQNQELICTKSLTSDKAFKLPAGLSGNRFEVEVESNLPVYQIDFATSMRELQ